MTGERARSQRLFYALADHTRRDILELLATNGQMSATEIYGNFKMTHPAVSQHLRVLREADLVRQEKNAQRRIYSLNTDSVLELEHWVKQLEELWEERFDRLDKVLEAEKRRGLGKER